MRILVGHGPTSIKPSSSSDTLCQAVAAPAAQGASLQDSSSSSVTPTPVTIVLARRVGFGDRIAVVGDTHALGRWSVLDGVPLQWQEGDVWRGEVSLQPGMHEFKVSHWVVMKQSCRNGLPGIMMGCRDSALGC
jgi:hypothetical protein